MALTPEEQAELQALEMELGDTSSTGLSAEESAELAALEAELGDSAPAPVEDENMGLIEGAVATTRRVAKGFLPFSNQIAAAGSAALSPITDKISDTILGTDTKPSTFAERYQRDLETIRRQELDDKEQLGIVGTGAEIAGTITGVSKITKGAQALGQAVNITGAAKALNLGNKSAVVGKMLAMGTLDATHAVMSDIDSKGINEDTKKIFRNGMAFSIGAQAATGVVGKIFSSLKDPIGNAVDKTVAKATISRVTKNVDKGVAEFTHKYSKEGLEETMEVLGMGSKNLLEDPLVFRDHVKSVTKKIGSEISDLYDDVDVVTGGLPVNPIKVIDDIKYRLGNMPKSELGKEAIAKLQASFDNIFISPTTGEYKINTAKQLWSALNDINEGIINIDVPPKTMDVIYGAMRDNLKEANKHGRQALQSRVSQGMQMNKLIEEEKFTKEYLSGLESTLNNLKEEGAKGLGFDNFNTKYEATQKALNTATSKLNNVTKQLMDMAKKGVTPESVKQAGQEADNITEGLITGSSHTLDQLDKLIKTNAKYEKIKAFNNLILDKGLPKSSGGFLVDAARELGSFRGIARKATAGYFGGPLAAAAVGIGEVGAKGYAATLDKFASETSEVIMGRQAKSLANFFSKAGDNSIDTFTRGVSANVMRYLSDDDLPPDQAWANIQSEMSKYDLYEKPVLRTDKSVAENFDSIMNILTVENPAMAQALASAKDNQQDLGPLLDKISKQEGTRKFFAGGLGWNGRVYSDEDKAALANDVNSLTSVPDAVKKQYVADIFANGTIPDFTKIPKRQPKVYQGRNKRQVR